MRISLLGNTCNVHYTLAKFLRQKGVDAYLYFRPTDIQQLPESEDPDLADNHPHWIKRLTPRSRLTPYSYIPPQVLSELKKSDLIQTQGFETIWATQAGCPYIFNPFGGDLWLYPILSLRNRSIYTNGFQAILALTKLQQSILNSHRIILGWYDRLWENGYRFLKDGGAWKRVARLPLAIDTTRFFPSAVRRQWPAPVLGEKLANFQMVIFHPSRQMFTRKTLLKNNLGEGKANDVFYRALAELVHHHKASVAAVIVDTLDSDVNEAKVMLRELNLESNTFWISKMPRHQLIQWYQAADLVVDALGEDAPGLITIEAMACGAPVLMKFTTTSDNPYFLDPYEMFEVLPPIINSSCEAEIVEKILYYLSHMDELAQLGDQSYQWVIKNIDGRNVVNNYIRLYEEVLAG